MLELMLVIAVIGIIIVGLMTTLFRPRMVANETSAIASLKALITAENQYATAYGSRYGDLSTLSSTTPPYVDAVLGGCRKSGYTFILVTQNFGSGFHVHANPVVPGKTATRFFYVDDNGVIRFNLVQQAESGDRPME